MARSTLVDLVKVLTTTTGVGPLILDTAVPSFRGVEALIDGSTYSYSIQQGANYEFGTGLYSALDLSLTRGVLGSSYGDAPLPLIVGATVTFVALGRDVQPESVGPEGPPGPMGPPAIQLAIFFTNPLAASEVFALYAAPAAFLYPQGFVGSVGTAQTPPAALMIINVARQDGGAGPFSAIGTITIQTSGVVSFATTIPAVVAIAVGDVVKFTGPATPDTAANFSATLKGY